MNVVERDRRRRVDELSREAIDAGKRLDATPHCRSRRSDQLDGPERRHKRNRSSAGGSEHLMPFRLHAAFDVDSADDNHAAPPEGRISTWHIPPTIRSTTAINVWPLRIQRINSAR